MQGCKGLFLVSGKSTDAQSSASSGQPDISGAQDKNSPAGNGSDNGGQAAGAPDNSGSGSGTQDGGQMIHKMLQEHRMQIMRLFL